MTTQRTLYVCDGNSRSLQGRVCLLLGALAAPGPEIACALARDGCHVVLADSDSERLQDLAASIERSGSEGAECCLIPELDKPYRGSNLAICAGAADLIIDNREWADYTRHSVSQKSRVTRRSDRNETQPSIYLLYVPAPDLEMNALLALDLTMVMSNPALILSAQAACRLLRGKIRWYRVQKRFGELESLIVLALSRILNRSTDGGRTAADGSQLSELMVELARGADSPRSLFRLRIDCLSKILEDRCCSSAVATIAELLGRQEKQGRGGRNARALREKRGVKTRGEPNMESGLLDQPMHEVSAGMPLVPLAQLQSLNELVCHLLWKNQQLRMPLNALQGDCETNMSREVKQAIFIRYNSHV